MPSLKLIAHKLTAQRRFAQATAPRPIETAKATATAEAPELAISKEAKEARDVALSKVMLEAAAPRPLFSVGSEPNVRKPMAEGVAVAGANEEVRERKERMTRRALMAARAAQDAAPAAQESAYKGPSREELAAQGLDGKSFDIEGIKPAEFNGDVRNLPAVASSEKIEFEPEPPPPSPEKLAAAAAVAASATTGKAAQVVPLTPMPSPTQNFAGLSFSSAVTGGQAGAGYPPDINGDVGPNHYIVAVNDAWAIYNKTGTQLAAFTENSLWATAGTGTPCDSHNQGDPVVIYDQFADRWILTNFAFATSGTALVGPYYQCFAVSKTSDPVAGGYWLYAVRMDSGTTGQPPVNTLNDYPHFGNWNDGCLYMSANEFGSNGTSFSGVLFASFNKADMESGATLRGAIGFSASNIFTMIPSNISGAKLAASLPPAGTPNYFVSESQTAFAFEVRKFTPGANCQGGSLGAATNVSQTSYGLSLGNVVPQSGTTNTLDSLDDRLMQKVQYRRVGSAESLWVTHTTRSSGATTQPQWAQINVTGTTVTTTPVQQQIYAPDVTLYRWMASIAADHNGNAAMGYSTSSATAFPGIAYSGRLVGDPLNSLPQTEVQLIGGAGSQTNNCGGAPCHRWGDYTAMSVDPADDCTFWYINEYYSASGGNWNTRVGAFKFPTCSSPTAVKVKAFTADGFADGQVLLQWNTSYEVDNLGYNVYREVNGQRTRVNSQLIAGSALITGHAVALSSGRAYAWSDQPSNGSAARYWLEDVDVNGKTSMTGPVTVTVKKGKAPTNEQSLLLTQLGQSQEMLVGGQGSVPVERRASVARVTAAGLQAQADLAGGNAFKVGVSAEGWYRIPQRDLVAAGLDAKSDPRLLQLFVDGRQVPIIVNGEADGKFDDTDSVEFYGVGLNSLFTAEHVYWLAVGNVGGQRIKAVQATGGTPAPAGFPTSVERKDRTLYFSALRNGDAENFFGPVINTTGVAQTVDVKNLMPLSSGATLDVAVQGVNLGAHQVKVLVNGSAVGTMTFDGQRLASQTFSLPASLLKEGANSVQLTALGGAADISLVDTLRINYTHKYAADNNQLRFMAQGGQQVALGGFTSTNVRVMDVTDPNSPQELRGPMSGGKAGSGLTLSVPGTGQRTLYAFAAEQAKSAAPRKDTPSTWRQAGRSADYVVITRGDLVASVTTLANYRRGQGYKVAVVDVEDLFDEFSYGNRSPQAVRDFLAFAKANWAVAPRFVLLAGDGTFDYKNYLGLGNTDVVPAKLVDTIYMETVSDDWYVDFDDDGVPDMAIGRLPVRDATEASRVVAKIIGYDSQPAANSVLFVSDTNDSYDFTGSNASLRPLMPPTLKVAEIQRGSADDATVRAKLIESLNGGHTVVSYSGHGSVNSWRGNLLTSDDAGSLTNGKSLELFVVMNCLNGYYIDPAFSSIGEELLRAQQGGAVAVWASSGQSEGVEQTILSQEFYRQLFGQTPLTVGEAAVRAKSAVSNPDIRRTWTLLGDPALRLK